MRTDFKKTPTIIDIARKVGMNKATVSRALRGSPLISETTKEKIRTLARKMGYHPNMVFSIMGSGNRTRGAKANLLPLAYLHDIDEVKELDPRANLEFGYLMDSARRYGYNLDQYNLRHIKNARSFERMLYHRGYCGIIFGRITHDSSLTYELDLAEFTVIFNTNTVWGTKYHRVMGDVYSAVQMAWDKALASGYRRIGVTTCSHSPALPDDEFRFSALLQRQNRDSKLVEKIPPFTNSPTEMDLYRKWIERWHPDMVIGFHPGHYYNLKNMGYGIPEDIGYAQLIVIPGDLWQKGISGIRSQERQVAETTISLLDQEIRKRVHGIPKYVLSVHIEPEWIKGKTLPAHKPTAAGR